jgi:hypothetical protein
MINIDEAQPREGTDHVIATAVHLIRSGDQE